MFILFCCLIWDPYKKMKENLWITRKNNMYKNNNICLGTCAGDEFGGPWDDSKFMQGVASPADDQVNW